ncbi:MAG: hypothetical protein ACPGES_10605 [Coraliomargarita sp.]
MRIFLLACFSLFVIACSSTPKEAITSVEITDISPRFIPEETFKRIHEYRTGADYQGNRVILRTDPQVRDGFYFVLTFDTKLKKLPQGTSIKGEFFTPDATEPVDYEFKLPAKRTGTKEIFLGLTGDAWTHGSDIKPSAWRFTVTGPDGQEFAKKKSYLWSF